MKKKVIVTLLILVCLYIIICILLFLFQESLIFFPENLPEDYSFRFSENFIEKNYKIDEKTKINTLLFKTSKSKGIIFYHHGNTGSMQTWGNIYEDFTQLSYDFFIYDYRGYGKSTGRISEKALFSDALFLYDKILSSYSQDKIIVFGRSIGSGIAFYVASKRKPHMLILESPFYSMKDLVFRKLPWAPSFLLRYNFRSDIYLKNVTCPVFIFHGTNDSLIYFRSSKKLIKLGKEQDKLFPIYGGEHNGLRLFKEYKANLKMILK